MRGSKKKLMGKVDALLTVSDELDGLKVTTPSQQS